jgi:NodT family efflux transporter outer membrane factor (OMF) lipoprotein
MKLLASIVLLALCGCAVGPDFQEPAPPAASTYTREPPQETAAAGGAAQTFANAERAPDAWWTEFHNDALNRLVDQALHDSPTLAQARSRLVEASEMYTAQTGGTRYPQVNVSASGTRQQIDLAAFGIPNAPSTGPFSLFDASLNVSYVLDIFGSNRRALEATMAQVDYEAFELEAARLALAGNVVATAIRRASLLRQVELTRQIEAGQARQLAILDQRLAAGGVAEIDVRGMRTLLEQTRATLPPLTTQLAQSEHLLAVLLGIEPGSADLGDIVLDSLQLPGVVPLTLPSTLARQRPDIRAAEAVLHQASAEVGVATANLYPQFVISAGLGSERARIADVVDGTNVWNVGLNLTQPIFHGGELRAKKRAAEAAYTAAFAGYRQVVLQALQQVADVLVALENDAGELDARGQAAREAQATLATSRVRLTAGGLSQFALLDSERQALQTSLDRARAQGDRLADTAALFQSLGSAAIEEK